MRCDPARDLSRRVARGLHDEIRCRGVFLAPAQEKSHEALLQRTSAQERTSARGLGAQPRRGGRRIDGKPHDPRPRSQRFPISGAPQDSAPARENQPLVRIQDVIQDARFQIPETLLSLLFEDRGNGSVRPPLDLPVQIDALESQPFRQEWSHGALSRSRQTDQGDARGQGLSSAAKEKGPFDEGPRSIPRVRRARKRRALDLASRHRGVAEDFRRHEDEQLALLIIANGPPKWDAQDWEHRNPDGLKQALFDQLGLELAPGRAPIEMLIVEKNK